MKKINKLLLCALISTATIAGTAHADDKIKIGFANRTLNGAFFNGLDQYLKQHAKEQGYEIISTDARGDLNKQIADVEDMISQGINYLVLNPQDPEAGVRITKIAESKGIPVITIDSDIPLTAPVLTRVMADNVKNNVLMGEYAVEQFGSTPMNCVFISGSQGNLAGEARRSSFVKGVVEAQLRKYNHTNLVILSQGWGNWDQQGGLKAMEDIIVAQGDKVNCVLSESDEMTLGTILALKAANKLDNVKVYSNDGYKKALESISRGDLQATVSNNPDTLTSTVVDIITEHAKGQKSFPDYSYIPPIVIKKDNVDKHYNAKALY